MILTWASRIWKELRRDPVCRVNFDAMITLPSSAHTFKTQTELQTLSLILWLGEEGRLRINCSEIEQRSLGQGNTKRISRGALSLQLKAAIFLQNTWTASPGIRVSFRRGITLLFAEWGWCKHWYEYISGPYGRHLIQSGVKSAKTPQEVRKGGIFFLKFYGTHITTYWRTLGVHSKTCLL